VDNRDASNKQFDPSSLDDVAALVGTWTSQGAVTASQIVQRLRARGVMVRSSTSGRHVIVDSPRAFAGAPPETRRFALQATPDDVPQAVERVADSPARPHHVIRPPGQTLHRIAALISKRTRERILDPIIADMQLEYCEALADERPRKITLWLVQARAWVAFGEAIFLRTVVGRIISGLSRLV
jgi:hypothetical protein